MTVKQWAALIKLLNLLEKLEVLRPEMVDELVSMWRMEVKYTEG